MITLYLIKKKGEYVLSPVNGVISEDKEKVEDYLENQLAYKDLFEITSIKVNHKCKCDDYWKTTMVIIIKDQQNEMKLLAADNLVGLYRKLGIPLEINIETFANGSYLMSLDYFTTNYMICGRSKDLLDIPYNQIKLY